MTNLEERLSQNKLKLLDEEIINGLHAGTIVRIKVLDEKNSVRKLIYKEFATDRKNEIDIYKKLFPEIQSFVPVINIWTTEPEAILMEDLGASLKKSFEGISNLSKRELLSKILIKLVALHTGSSPITDISLPLHKMTTEWCDWCCAQLEKLFLLQLNWNKSSWMDIVKSAYRYIGLSNYSPRGPFVLTHGDPHLDNVFQKKDGSISFIDWEWAALSSPLRDITILLQDIYDMNLIIFVKETYYDLLVKKGLYPDKISFKEDFNYYYLDHTLMMTAWEIEKYFQGYTTESKIKSIVEFKMREIESTIKEMGHLQK